MRTSLVGGKTNMANINKTIQLEFQINQADYDRIVDASGGDSVVAFKGLAEFFYHSYANGGLMLRPNDLARMSKSAGRPIRTAVEVSELVEKGASVKDGKNVFQLALDPSVLPVFEETAKTMGWTMDQLMQDCVNQIVDQGWLYVMSPGNKLIQLSDVDRQWLEGYLGTPNFYGADVVKKLREFVGPK